MKTSDLTERSVRDWCQCRAFGSLPATRDRLTTHKCKNPSDMTLFGIGMCDAHNAQLSKAMHKGRWTAKRYLKDALHRSCKEYLRERKKQRSSS